MKGFLLTLAFAVAIASSAMAADGCKDNSQQSKDPQNCQASSEGGGKPMPIPMPPMSPGGGNNDQPPQNDQQKGAGITRSNVSEEAKMDPPDDPGGRVLGGSGGVGLLKRNDPKAEDALSVDPPYGQDYDQNAEGTINIPKPARAIAQRPSAEGESATVGGVARGPAGPSTDAIAKPQSSFFGGLAPSKGGSGIQDQSWLAAPPGAMALSPSQQAMLQGGPSDSDQ